MFFDLSASGLPEGLDVLFEYAADRTLHSTWITLTQGSDEAMRYRRSVTMKLSTFSRLALLATPGRGNELQKRNPYQAFFFIDEDDNVSMEPLFDGSGRFKNAIGIRSAELLEKQPEPMSISLDQLQELAGFNLICLQLVHLLAKPGLVKPMRNVLHRIRLLPNSHFHFANESYDVRFAPIGIFTLSGMNVGDWKPTPDSRNITQAMLNLKPEQCTALLAMTVEEILTGLSRDGFVQMLDASTKLGIWPSTRDFPPPEPGLYAITEQHWLFISDCMRLYLATRAFFLTEPASTNSA